jgi:hypothetical protein
MNHDLLKMIILGGLAFLAFCLLATMHVWMVPKHALPQRREKQTPPPPSVEEEQHQG